MATYTESAPVALQLIDTLGGGRTTETSVAGQADGPLKVAVTTFGPAGAVVVGAAVGGVVGAAVGGVVGRGAGVGGGVVGAGAGGVVGGDAVGGGGAPDEAVTAMVSGTAAVPTALVEVAAAAIEVVVPTVWYFVEVHAPKAPTEAANSRM